MSNSTANSASDNALSDTQVTAILNNPDFQHMARKKSALSNMFSILTVVMYASYILMLGLNPKFFATPVSAGSTTTWGIYCGLGVILFSIIATAIYVHKANGEFDNMTNKVIEDIHTGRL